MLAGCKPCQRKPASRYRRASRSSPIARVSLWHNRLATDSADNAASSAAGDGRLDPGEGCDDGDSSTKDDACDGDGANALVVRLPGRREVVIEGSPRVRSPRCPAWR